MISYGISMDWDSVLKRPNWMRHGEFAQCAGKRCYFCLNGYTSGISHKREEPVV